MVDESLKNKWLIEIKETWLTRLNYFAMSYVRNVQVAEDLVKYTLLTILEHYSKLSFHENIDALLYTILRNKCLDYLKHQIIKLKYSSEITSEYYYLLANKYALEDSSIEIITNNQIRDALQKALEKLPSQTKGIICETEYFTNFAPFKHIDKYL